MVNSLADIIALCGSYTEYLRGIGFPFDEDGFPVHDRTCFLEEWPEVIVDYYHRNAAFVANPGKTLIGFFTSDALIFRRCENLLVDLPEYRKYMGVVQSDLTVTRDMDLQWQRFVILFNQLVMATFEANGIRVCGNTRSGAPETIRDLLRIPRGVMWASSSLGCAPLSSEADFRNIAKVLMVCPSKLALYGKSDSAFERQLEASGVCFRSYPDAHSVSSRYSKDKKRRESGQLALSFAAGHSLKMPGDP